MKREILHLLPLLLLLGTACSNSSKNNEGSSANKEPSVSIPKHQIFQEKVTENTSNSKQVIVKAVIDNKDITEKKVKRLLVNFYNTYTTQFSMPINLDAKVYRSRNLAESQWAGWLTKNYKESEYDISINERQLKGAKSTPQKKYGLKEDKRKEIFKAMVSASDRAREKADEQYSPADYPEKNIDYNDKLTKKYKTQVREKYGISKAIQDSIKYEGIEKGWPMPK